MLKKSISGETKTCCIIGHPVEHTFSPMMHNLWFEELGLDYIYTAYNVHPQYLEKAVDGIRALGIKGLNVTIPHKVNIMQYLDEIDSKAAEIGSINTIKNEDGYLMARNTDAEGAQKSLLDAGCSLSGKKILIIGAGGVARALCYVLSVDAEHIVLTDTIEEKALNLAKMVKESLNVSIVGRKSNDKIIEEEIKNTDILINATPLGMHPNENISPIPQKLLHSDLFVFDVIYNPLETKLMKDAAEIGCTILGGLDMLINQGFLAFEWWTGKKPDTKLMKNKIIEYLEVKNSDR